MPWFEGTQTYYNWPRSLLPYTRWDIEIETLSVKCRRCNGKTDSLRGQAVEYDACTEIRIGAYCPACNMITYARTRVYPDGHVTWDLPGGWRELAWRPRFKGVLKHLLECFR